MKSFCVLTILFSALSGWSKIHPHFLETTPYSKDQQTALISQMEILCPDANQYGWTLAEQKTDLVRRESGVNHFATTFVVISAYMRNMDVKASVFADGLLKVQDLQGCNW